MSRDQRRYLLVIGLLAAALIGALLISQRQQLGASQTDGYQYVTDIDNWQRTERERIVSSPYDFSLAGDLARVPMTLGEWVGADVPQTNLEVFILLEPEQYVQRLYRLPDGRYLWLSLIGSRQSKSFHSPQICYDADGWQTDVGSEIVTLSHGEVYTLLLQARKSVGTGAPGVVQDVVSYLYLWPSFARSSQEGMVLVKVTAPIFGSAEQTLALEKQFLRLLFTAARER